MAQAHVMTHFVRIVTQFRENACGIGRVDGVVDDVSGPILAAHDKTAGGHQGEIGGGSLVLVFPV